MSADRQEDFDRFERLHRALVVPADVEDPPGLRGTTVWSHLAQDLESWNDYGDLRWDGNGCGTLSGNHYDWSYGMALHFLRTGRLDFTDAARLFARHEEDLDVYHTAADGAAFSFQKNWEDRPSHDSPDNCFGGGRPTHTWSQGYALHWLLTGDPRGKDAFDEIQEGLRLYLYESFSGEGHVSTSEIRTHGWLNRFGQRLLAAERGASFFVPVVLDLPGLNGSRYTTELTLTNRGTGEAHATFTYVAFAGGGSGSTTAPLSIPPGRQVVLPDAVEAGGFTTEVVLAELSGRRQTLGLTYAASAVEGGSTRVSIDLEPYEQRIVPDVVGWLRALRAPGVGPAGAAFAGPLLLDAEAALAVMARTVAADPLGRGRYGLAYAAAPHASLPTGPVHLDGLRKGGDTRTNLALVNPGESAATFRVELFSGATGAKAGETTETLGPLGFLQVGRVLATLAPGADDGWARVTPLFWRTTTSSWRS
jgi:hypothetical protein